MGSITLVRCGWFGWGGVVSLCRLKLCFILHKDTTPPQPNHTVTRTNIEPEQYNTWNKSTVSRKLLKMDVLTFETCWAVNSEIIKQVTSVGLTSFNFLSTFEPILCSTVLIHSHSPSFSCSSHFPSNSPDQSTSSAFCIYPDISPISLLLLPPQKKLSVSTRVSRFWSVCNLSIYCCELPLESICICHF